MADVKIENAVLVPSLDAIREFGKQLKAQLDSDPTLAAAFRRYPREVLANRGINKDLQSELLAEMGVVSAASCYVTCACTGGCCVTSVQ